MRKRGAVYGKRLTFLYNSPYEHVQYNVSGPKISGPKFQVLSVGVVLSQRRTRVTGMKWAATLANVEPELGG